jgi:hypothetical protein
MRGVTPFGLPKMRSFVGRMARPVFCASPEWSITANKAMAAVGEKNHLVFEGVRSKRPAVAKNDRLTSAPVLVININVGPIFLPDGNE